jgi:hypothetical protein
MRCAVGSPAIIFSGDNTELRWPSPKDLFVDKAQLGANPRSTEGAIIPGYGEVIEQ